MWNTYEFEPFVVNKMRHSDFNHILAHNPGNDFPD